MAEPLKDYLLQQEAAKLCGVVPGTIRNWVARGMLKVAFTSGHQKFLKRSDVEKFLSTHEKDSRCRRK